MSAPLDTQIPALNEGYKYGFVTEIETESAPPGLDEDTVRFISAKKGEPEWLLDWRLQAFRAWEKMAAPNWWRSLANAVAASNAPCARPSATVAAPTRWLL